ncbi:hypothetical protein CBL_01727 [Carabus blaptoides fortunei]
MPHQELKKRFRKEYLAQLVQRGKDKKIHTFQIGDVVLVEMDNKKRILWPMGKISELITGKDGVARVAKLQTKSGMLIRPLQRLFPLEVSYNDNFNPIPRKKIKDVNKTLTLRDPVDVMEVRTQSGRLSKKPDSKKHYKSCLERTQASYSVDIRHYIKKRITTNQRIILTCRTGKGAIVAKTANAASRNHATANTLSVTTVDANVKQHPVQGVAVTSRAEKEATFAKGCDFK